MLVGVVLNSLFVVLDVALDIPLRLSLVSLGNAYSSAQTGAQQASVSAAAQTIMDASNLVALVATVFQFSAVIIASLVMLKSGTSKRTISYVGVVCGVVAILFLPAFVGGGAQLAGLFNIGGFVLLVIWSVGRASGFASSDCQELCRHHRRLDNSASAKKLEPWGPSYRTPFMKNVGVPLTPLLTPPMKSSWILDR
jgi:hypothetical protein